MAETKRKRVRIKYPPTDNPKTCKRCGTEKPAERFFVAAGFKDGRDCICKDCRNPVIVAKNSSPERRAIINARAKTRSRESRQIEHAKAAAKEGKTYTPKDMAALAERRLYRNAEVKARRSWRDWLYMQAPSAWLDGYYSARPWQDHRLNWTQRSKLQYRLDPDFHLRERIRLSNKAKLRKRGVNSWKLRKALKTGDEYEPVWNICGYTVAELRKHIERQFAKGMTWAKFCAGEIDIDHIVPLRLFDLTERDGVKQAWALTNLRPAWPNVNNAKGGHRVHLL